MYITAIVDLPESVDDIKSYKKINNTGFEKVLCRIRSYENGTFDMKVSLLFLSFLSLLSFYDFLPPFSFKSINRWNRNVSKHTCVLEEVIGACNSSGSTYPSPSTWLASCPPFWSKQYLLEQDLRKNEEKEGEEI